MRKKLIIIINLILIAILFVSFSYYFANNFYYRMVTEDGTIENITAIVLLVISLLFLFRLIKSRNKSLSWIIFSTLIVLGSFFGFGEEISWGQRIFSIESGEFFSQYNLQNETNLHNLKFNDVKINKIVFSYGFITVFGIYFLLTPFLYRQSNWFKKMVDNFGIPIPKYKHAIYIIILTALIMVIPDYEKWELWESIFVLMLLMIFIEPYNSKEKLFPEIK